MDWKEKLLCLQYASGGIVDVDKALFRLILKQDQVLLDLEERELDVGVTYVDVDIREALGVKAFISIEDGRLITPRKQHIATIHHESTHYLMHLEGLLINPSMLMGSTTSDLINETVAETAVCEIIGFSDFYKDVFAYYQGLKKIDSKVIEELEKAVGVPDNIHLADNLIGVSFFDVDLASRLRGIEERYAINRDLCKVDEEMEVFRNYIDRARAEVEGINDYLSSAVKILAVSNAQNLINEGYRTRDVVSWIKESFECNKSVQEIYFNDIVAPSNGLERIKPKMSH